MALKEPTVEFFKTLRQSPSPFMDHEWRWRLKARNGLIIVSSSEGFDSKRNAERNFITVRSTIRLINMRVKYAD